MTDIDDSLRSGAEGIRPAPDLMAPVHGFRDWRATEEGLCSPRTEAVWETRTMRARCHPRTADDFVRDSHDAPGRDCNCGIHAHHRFSPEFSKIDHQGVSGVVSLWGHVEVHRDGMRAEYARVEVLGVYSRWTRRQKDAVRNLAERLDVDLADLYDLPEVAHLYATPMPAMLIPDRGPRKTSRRRRAYPAPAHGRLVIVGQ